MTIRKENIHAALTDLATRYPRAFVLEKYRPHRPLKVGVAADILARCPVLTRRELGPALAVYAKRVMYLQSLVAGAIRIDLDGNPAGEVSAADAEHAAATLAEILAAREAKRAAAMVAKNTSRITRQAAATAPAPPPAAAAGAVEPPAAKVLTPREARRAAAMVAKNASRITRQAAATAPAPPPAAAAVEPSAAKVLTLKERPVLRLPAFRQQRG